MKVYSNVLGDGKVVYTSGQLALDENGNVAGDNIYDQTKKALENVYAAISEAGFAKHNIVSLTIYLADIVRDFAKFNEAYIECFKECKPARATIGATLFKADFLIEIQAVANIDVDNRK